eukprot:scaffold94945_cov42-Phaeocystis_antarctica.AAC.1
MHDCNFGKFSNEVVFRLAMQRIFAAVSTHRTAEEDDVGTERTVQMQEAAAPSVSDLMQGMARMSAEELQM